MSFSLAPLPVPQMLETKTVLRKTTSAGRLLAELKGFALSIPNQNVLIDTLSIQEAKDSSAIENIVTTQDELFMGQIFENISPAAKEVRNYIHALRKGIELISRHKLLTVNHICEIQGMVESEKPGFRKLPGTVLRNAATREVVYTPPQHPDEIVALMGNLEKFINDESMADLDPLVKMAVLHYQFESIHPFYDGNGRTGRIINVLYLALKGLLEIPVLYLSRHINRTRPDYYRLLQEVRTHGGWEAWVLYMLDAVEQTTRHTLRSIREIHAAMLDFKHRVRAAFPKIYSQDLVNHLFSYPYTTIGFYERNLGVSRPSAVKYLNQLAGTGLLRCEKFGREYYFVNIALCGILAKIDDPDMLDSEKLN